MEVFSVCSKTGERRAQSEISNSKVLLSCLLNNNNMVTIMARQVCTVVDCLSLVSNSSLSCVSIKTYHLTRDGNFDCVDLGDKQCN